MWKTRLESQLSRMNCQMFSTGFNSGHFGGSGMRVMLRGHDEVARQVPAGLIEQENGMLAGRDLGGDLGEVQVHRLGVAAGQDERRALALAAGRWRRRCRSRRCADRAAREGRVPRLAQRRVILFFWPIRASSANQTSMSSTATPLSRAICCQAGGEVFLKASIAPLGLGMMARARRELAVAHGAQLPAHGLLGDA